MYKITYSIINFNDAGVEVWEWITIFVTPFTRHVVTYPCQTDNNKYVPKISFTIKLSSFQSRNSHYKDFLSSHLILIRDCLYRKTVLIILKPLDSTWFSRGVYIGFTHDNLHSIMLLLIAFMLFGSTLNKHTYVLDMIYVSGWVSYLRVQTETGVPAPTWQGIQQ